MERILVPFVALFIMALPGMLFLLIWRKLSKNVKSLFIKRLIFTGLIAIGFTPTIHGHAGIVPAILVVIIGGEDKIEFGVVPILIVWIILFVLLSLWNYYKSSKMNQSPS